MAGLDLPVKLRRGLGNGKVVPAEELEKRLEPYDRDKDGAITQEELVRFLQKNRVGGPWFCQVLAKTLWRIVEEQSGLEVDSISVPGLGRIINYSMSAPPRPEKRYILDPEAMQGLKPFKTLEELQAEEEGRPPPKKDGAAKPEQSSAGPRPKPRSRSKARAKPRRKPRRPGPKPRR